MKRFIKVLLPVFAITAVLFAFDVKTDYSHHADFSRYHTYSWIKAEAGNQLWADRITRDVDAALQAKGWQKVPSGGDASVAAFGSTHNQRSLQTFYDTFGGGWYWSDFGDGMATTTVQNTPVGTLVVDVFDSHSKKLIWRGTASDSLSDKPEKNQKKLEHAVSEMFEHFPPHEKG